MPVRRVTKAELEAQALRQTEEVKALNLRVKFWVRHANVTEALLRLLGGYDYSRGEHVRTLLSIAEELRKSAERPLPSEQLIADQLAIVAPLATQFYEKEDSLIGRFNKAMKPAIDEYKRASDEAHQSSRDLRIPIPMRPGGSFVADEDITKPPVGGYPHQKLARARGAYSVAEKAAIKKATKEVTEFLKKKVKK